MRCFVHMDRIGCFAAIGIHPLTLPFIFRFGNQNSVGRKSPRIFHRSDVNTLCLAVNPSFLPSAPNHVTLSVVFESTRMNCPVVIFVGRYAPFHDKLTLCRNISLVFNHINLVIVHITIVCCEVNIPFVVDAMHFGGP